MQFCEVPLPTENGMRYCMKYGRICEDEYALVSVSRIDWTVRLLLDIVRGISPAEKPSQDMFCCCLFPFMFSDWPEWRAKEPGLRALVRHESSLELGLGRLKMASA